jgi:acetyltransferase-like isoleucine patch superfamily enzyme
VEFLAPGTGGYRARLNSDEAHYFAPQQDSASRPFVLRRESAGDDFANDLVAIIPPGVSQVKTHLIYGDVEFGNYTAVGSNSVVMPKNVVPEGTVIGALSFVPVGFDFRPWSVYAGVPIRYLGPRNRENVLGQMARLEEHLRQKVGS